MQVAKKSGNIPMGSSNVVREAMNKVESPYEMVGKLGSSNAVVMFSMSGCCMCTVAKRLLFGLGVAPTVIELDQHFVSTSAAEIQSVLYDLAGDARQIVPAIFVGGKFLGGVETLMACHINGSLIPLLKDAGALWL
ncbi:hypothetical protein FNV43_RR06042 [Rhamnella rubrinervis]|uniref:Glutaredoxin domain-containing protein n=1 Tax=Rhamnella rubrinervis TaxID=2594499 RepID=A0A8K0MLE4_9ROSA|nr:hypothetical protein FNV43_RR06042 [Rhamnella rubrinervis]